MSNPLLYDHGATVPMALTTAFGFGCIGTAIVAAAGKNSLPLQILTGRSTRAKLLRVFLPLVMVAMLIESLASLYIPILFPIHSRHHDHGRYSDHRADGKLDFSQTRTGTRPGRNKTK